MPSGLRMQRRPQTGPLVAEASSALLDTHTRARRAVGAAGDGGGPGQGTSAVDGQSRLLGRRHRRDPPARHRQGRTLGSRFRSSRGCPAAHTRISSGKSAMLSSRTLRPHERKLLLSTMTLLDPVLQGSHFGPHVDFLGFCSITKHPRRLAGPTDPS